MTEPVPRAIPSLSRNIAYNLAGQSALLVLGFISVRFVFTGLGADALGIVYFTLTLSGVILAAVDLGINSTAVREVSAHHGVDDMYVADLARTASLIYWSAFGLLAVVTYVLAPYLVTAWLHLGGSIDEGTATEAVRVMTISGLLVLPRSLYTSVLRGLQRMALTNVLDVGLLALQQIGLIVVIALGGGLRIAAWWLAISYLLAVMAFLSAVTRYLGPSVVVPRYSAKVVRRNLVLSRSLTAISVFSAIHTEADKILVSKFLPVALLGSYGFVSTVIGRASVLTEALAITLLPTFSRTFGRGDRVALLRQYRQLQDLQCLASVPIFAGVVFFAPAILRYTFDAGTSSMLSVPIVLLSIGSYMHGTLYAPHLLSVAVGRPDISARATLVALAVVLPITVGLVYFGGLNGAAFSWIVYHVFMYGYAVPRIARECIGIAASEWYGHVARISLAALLAYATMWAGAGVLVPGSISALVVAFVIGSLLFLAETRWLVTAEFADVIARGRIGRLAVGPRASRKS